MLIIRDVQMETLRAASLSRFEQQQVQNVLKFAPRHAASLGDQQLRLCVHHAVARSREQGFTLRGPVQLWVELTFMFGTDFDSDPQLHKLKDALSGGASSEPMDQVARAENLRGAAVEFARCVSGEGGNSERAAVGRFRHYSLEDLSMQSDEEMVGNLGHIYPEKVDAVGTAALHQIIEKARTASQSHRLNHPSAAMALTLLMFTFGHGCAADPLFPWIAESLSNFDVDSRSRLESLRRKSGRFIAAGFEGD